MTKQTIQTLLEHISPEHVTVQNLNTSIQGINWMGAKTCQIKFDTSPRNAVAMMSHPTKTGNVPEKLALILWVNADAIPQDMQEETEEVLSVV